jgi:hypothetical protein
MRREGINTDYCKYYSLKTFTSQKKEEDGIITLRWILLEIKF